MDGSDGITLKNTLTGFTGAITINNLSNPVKYSISGNNGLGLNIVSANGLVLLNGLIVDENRNGAEIHNGSGSVFGNVSVLNSRFNSNTDGPGLLIDTKGAISLTKTDASNNSSFGAKLDNEYASKYLPITVTNDAKKIGYILNGFSDNGEVGLIIIAKGAVSITNVEANINDATGATVDIINAPNYDLRITNS